MIGLSEHVSSRPARAGLILLFVLAVGRLPGEDWPTHKRDNARSAITPEGLRLPLVEAWVYRSPYPPQVAWSGPAKWDGWHKIHNLKDRLAFDRAFQVAAAGDTIFFGSSADDTVYCLDASNGEISWRFATEGPVRLAPSVSQGKLYVGSDDGCVYCLDSRDGRLVWKHRPGPRDRRVPSNGRLVSLWAVRTGVVVVDGTAYCGAGVFPSETVYVCAMDAGTGRELWKTPMPDLTSQGYLLASPKRLYVPTGRDRPVVLERASGTRLYQVEGGGGGTYALLTGDRLLYGPGKTGQLSFHGESQKDQLASFPGHQMIVTSTTSYLQTDKELAALDRPTYVDLFTKRSRLAGRKGKIAEELKKLRGKASGAERETLQAEIGRIDAEIGKLSQAMKECFSWRQPCDSALSLILAGDVLFAGGAGKVVALSTSAGETIWKAPVSGGAFGLAVANGRLFVSTDEGAIHCFTTQGAEGQSVVEHPSGNEERTEKPQVGTSASPSRFLGPFLEFLDRRTIRVRWDTERPLSSVVEWGRDRRVWRRFSDGTLKTHHSITVPGVERDTVYSFRLEGAASDGTLEKSRFYRFDSTFNFAPLQNPSSPSPYPADAWSELYERTARRILDVAGVHKGYCLVLGAGEGRLAYHLAKLSELQIVAVEDDPKKVERARRVLAAAGLHGVRVSVHRSTGGGLPYGSYFANLIVSDSMLLGGKPAVTGTEMVRLLRPSGGVAYLGEWSSAPGEPLTREAVKDWARAAGVDHGTNGFREDEGLFWVYRRGPLPGAREWTHQYGRPDNSASSGDLLVGGKLEVQWWGRPGPRPMPDRGPRNPAPVSSNGRLYVQGDRILFGMDAYNGTILWCQQIPEMRRANVPRDGSNMVATDDYLYVAIGPYCVGFRGQTGVDELKFRVPERSPGHACDWGYVACVNSTLLGSGVRRGAHYLGDRGEWYEEFKFDEIARVTSEYLFALDRHRGFQRWAYEGGVIINSTITVGDGVLYFVESRNPAAKASPSGRMLEEVQRDQYLVAVDLGAGKPLWEAPCDFSKCQYMTYLSYGGKTLVATGSDKAKNYHTYAFDAESGKSLWEHHADAKKTHHSGHLGHPVIVGGRLYLNKHTYELRTGKVLKVDPFDYHGCGTMSASSRAIFYRFEYHGMWDLETDTRTEFPGVRSGCWLGLIPSGGLLLAPDTSAGCSCTHALQTSMAYAPSNAAVAKPVPARGGQR